MKWQAKKFACKQCDMRVCVIGSPALVDQHEEQARAELCKACFRASKWPRSECHVVDEFI
jgi:membrane protein involved in colicin uptake